MPKAFEIPLVHRYRALAESHARLLEALKEMNRQFGYPGDPPDWYFEPEEHEVIGKSIEAIAAAKQFTTEGEK